MIRVDYFEAPWLADVGGLYAQVVGQEWINASARDVTALADYIAQSYSAHHTGERGKGTWQAGDFDLVKVDPPY